jgi:hypothetical protein
MTKDEQSQRITSLTNKVNDMEYNMKETQLMILSLLEKVEEIQMVLAKSGYTICNHSSVSELQSVHFMKQCTKKKLDY